MLTLETAESRYRELLRQEWSRPADLERALFERGELEAVVDEHHARSHDRCSADTRDEAARRVYERFYEEDLPRIRELRFEFDRKVVDSAHVGGLDPRTFGIHLRDLRAGLQRFRPENLELLAREEVLGQRHGQLIGAAEVLVDDERLTDAQAWAKLESPDRALRERAWTATTERRLADAERHDELFTELVRLRDRIGRNAGLDGYVPWSFSERRRFDYGPADCESFHAAVEEHLVPLHEAVLERRRSALGLDRIRPFDLRVEPGTSRLEPFGTTEELIEKTAQTFACLDPELAALFERLRDGESLDLGTRLHKAPGGFQNVYPVSRRCFVLMNATGSQDDVLTLFHEAGHAFHSMLGFEQPLFANRESCVEFCEVASMSMELLTLPHLGTFYDAPSREQVRRRTLERVVSLFPWIAQGDAFQHWVYAHPDADPEERAQAWVDLDRRFRPAVDRSGLEFERGREWHRVPHFFSHPLYYIDYAIAQLGALGLWQQSLEDEHAALERYKAALRLGGSVSLPEQFAAIGVPFDLGPETVARAADVLRRELF